MSTHGFSTTTDEVLVGVDLTGQRMVITGASTGLGEETARSLALHGAAITMAVRDIARGDAAADRIRATAPNADLEVRLLDLGTLASVRAFAQTFLAEHQSIDVLINNAGIMACPQATTSDANSSWKRSEDIENTPPNTRRRQTVGRTPIIGAHTE